MKVSVGRQHSIIEIPSEIAAGTRGSSLGASAIRAVSRTKQDLFFTDRRVIQIEDQNRSLDRENKTPHANYIQAYARVFKRVEETLRTLSSQNQKLIMLTGDHGNAAAIIKGIRKARPNQKMGLVWIDAHADIHSPYTTPSGNIHGMPIAVALGEDNIDKKRNALDPLTEKLWTGFKKIDNGSSVKPVYVGVRDTEEEEEYLMEKLKLPNITVADFKKLKVAGVVQQIKEHLSDCDYIYISFDVDSMDPDKVSYGTGTPVKGGLTLIQVKDLIQAIIKEIPSVDYFECTEVNPLLDDKQNTMAESAYEVIQLVDRML